MSKRLEVRRNISNSPASNQLASSQRVVFDVTIAGERRRAIIRASSSEATSIQCVRHHSDIEYSFFT